MSVGHKTVVAVIFGGRSSEHSIACVSAGSVLRALDRERYDVVPVGITKSGVWVLERDRADELVISDAGMPSVDPSGPQVALSHDPDRPGITVLGTGEFMPVDVAFPVLHGPFGEDGTVQGLLEFSGVPYVGCGVFASAAAMDKGHLKSLAEFNGIPVAPFVAFTRREWEARAAELRERIVGLGLPVFVKPCRAGSSVGISKVKHESELDQAIAVALAEDPRVLVEASVEGARELECGVLVDAPGGVPVASECAEIRVRSGHEFYDFEAKYLDDSADLIVPAPLDEPTRRELQQRAVDIFSVVGCEGLARVDFLLDPSGKLVLNEINTMPGFTSISMFPRMWQASGIGYEELVDRLVQDAVARGTGLRQ